MNNRIVYIYPAKDGERHTDYAIRFIETYLEHPPLLEHDTIVVLNGAKETAEITCMFSALPNVIFMERDDSGWDIGGYQDAARTYPCDLMAFFGGSTYFRREGWLLRMAQVQKKHGIALFGAMGNRGDPGVHVEPHIRTTGFWLKPDLLNAYPMRVNRQDLRYDFEHGPHCFTGWVKRQGLKAWVVSWTGEYLWEHWDDVPGGMHKANQWNLLVGDRLTEPPFYKHP